MSDASVVVAAREQISCDLADEVAILNLNSGVYYGLDAVGARIGLSAGEMVRRYSAGELDDPGRVADLLALARLLPEDDPLLVPA